MQSLCPSRTELDLDNDTPQCELKAMLRSFPAEVVTARMANPIMNKATVEGPECLAVATGGAAETTAPTGHVRSLH